MSKNLTRKGLAIGAAVALGSSVFAGAPAFAAGEVVFAPSTGTSYNTFNTESLTLAASLAPGQVAGNIVQLKYYVTVPTGATLEYKVNGGAAASLAATGAIAGSGSSTAANTLQLSYKYVTGTTAPTATSESISVPVVAWLDSDNDDVVDAGEFQQARTVGFKKYSEVVPTVTLTSALAADAAVKATVSLGDINVEQLGVTATAKGNVEIDFGITGTGTLAGTTTKADGVYSEVATSLTAADVVTARAQFKTVNLGTAAVSTTVAARTIATLVGSATVGANAINTGVLTADARLNSAFAVEAVAKNSSSVAVAGVPVTATVTTSVAASLSATKTLTVGSTVYNTANPTIANVALTTDANGKVSLNLASAGFAANDTITVTFKAQNFSSALVVTQKAAAYTVASTDLSGSVLRSIVEGGSATLTYAVKDQFDVAIGSGARLKFVVGYSTPATSYVTVNAGLASVTVTDTTASTDADITVDATLETQDVATGNWAAAGTPIVAAQHTVNVHSAAAAFDVDPIAASAALSTNVALTGASAAAISVNNAGAAVTVAAQGVTFTVNGKEYANTVTFFSGASGNIAVSAKSDIAGAKTVTFTVGSASKTATLTIAAAASNTGSALTISAPAKVGSGTTVTVSGKLVDKFGNPVAVTHALTATPASTDRGFVVTYDGPGLVIGSLPTATDANGAFSFKVLLGANDTGSATVTASYDLDGNYASITSTNPATSAAAITATATIKIGSFPVAAAVAGATKAVKLTVRNAANQGVVVTVNGKVVLARRAAADIQAFSIKTTAGKKSVVVKVAGKTVATRTVTVK